ncbi:MAG: hypothetical protein P8M28_05310 [Alphaproteobacteria bacterium]|nr:hypothetical protein [Alphaproteobacteria bacterium]
MAGPGDWLLSALSAVLWHWRVMPLIILGLAAGLKATLRIDGPVALGAAANIFVGMVEVAILIRPHLARMNRSDLFVTMTCGLTTIAGTVLVLYATFLKGVVNNTAGDFFGRVSDQRAGGYCDCPIDGAAAAGWRKDRRCQNRGNRHFENGTGHL